MNTKNTVLVADDDPDLRAVISALLLVEGFHVVEAANGLECLRVAYETHPDLVLLDILMPNQDGRQVCQRLREISNVPIIMLTSVSEEKQKVESLNRGADDYVTKPYDNNELIARVRSVLRRSRQSPSLRPHSYTDGHLSVDFEAREVRVANHAVGLSPKEWRLLECLIKNLGQVVPREVLLRYVWGDAYEREFNYLKVFVYHLRRKLGDSAERPRYIHTERDLGYRFVGRA